MPLPLILGGLAGLAAITGIGGVIDGAAKTKDAKNTMESANKRHRKNLARFEAQNKQTNTDMDELGTLELNILKSFQEFSDVFERIKNRPRFTSYNKGDVILPEYDKQELEQVSVGAGVLIGSMGGAALGTAGGFAAAGATTAAVMALGTASTGTAIATLSGAAATNATLAALGGGALAAGGGGIALGSTILGAATLGVGLLIGGLIFDKTASSLSDKADEAWSEMKRAEKEIDKICEYMQDLSQTSMQYQESLKRVNAQYKKHLDRLQRIVYYDYKIDWKDFTSEEQLITENTANLVALLFKMCKVELVLQSKEKNELNKVNHRDVEKSMMDADNVMESLHSI